MTKFFNYIKEEVSSSEIIKRIERDCQPFIRDLKKVNKLLLSGRFMSDPFVTRKVRKDRRPTDTPWELHSLVDEWFNKKFGINLRSNSVFATFSSNVAAGYGRTYYIFPIGRYESYWSPYVPDLFIKLKNLSIDVSYQSLSYWDDWDDVDRDKLKKGILDWLDNHSKYQKGLKYTENEIMISCDRYYLVNYKFETDIYNHFIKGGN